MRTRSSAEVTVVEGVVSKTLKISLQSGRSASAAALEKLACATGARTIRHEHAGREHLPPRTPTVSPFPWLSVLGLAGPSAP